jgi:hypothetical protein
MKIKLKSTALFLLISVLILSACQGAKTTETNPNTEVQNQAHTEEQGKPEKTTTEPTIYTDPDDIKIMLTELARVRQDQWLAHPGWWQEQRVIQSQSGNLHGAGGEWWFQFNDPQSCPQTLQIIYQDDGQILESSVLIRESELPTKLVKSETSDEENDILLVKVPDQSCPALFEITLDHVEEMLVASTLESAKAVIQNGYLTITLNQKDDPYGQVLIVTIDLKTGFITGEKNQLYIMKNEKPEGEVTYNYLYQYYDQLPLEIQSKFDQAFAELE